MIKLLAGLLVVSMAFRQNIFAQDKGTGLIYDPEKLKGIPKNAPLVTRGINLPKSVSLRKYAPTPGDQGNTSTCVAWASAYHARTIAESVRMNRTDKQEIDQNTFSISYVYNQIRPEVGCGRGTFIHQALEVMMNKGVPRYSEFGFDCEKEPNATDHLKASDYKILDYKLLFSESDYGKTTSVKQSLSNNYPVIFAMYTPPSFYPPLMDGKDNWQPDPGDYDYFYDCHAMLTIGYDDDIYGGSFLIMNSWGTTWGDGGFSWIRYNDYEKMALYAYEMIEVPAAEVDMNLAKIQEKKT